MAGKESLELYRVQMRLQHNIDNNNNTGLAKYYLGLCFDSP